MAIMTMIEILLTNNDNDNRQDENYADPDYAHNHNDVHNNDEKMIRMTMTTMITTKMIRMTMTRMITW